MTPQAALKLRNITTSGAWSLQSAGGFDCAEGDVVEAQLENLPALAVGSWTLSVVIGSLDASDLSFPGGPAASYSPPSPSDAFQFTVPSGVSSWLLRSQTNGGALVTDPTTGRPTAAANTSERVLSVRSASRGLRKQVPGESQQYSALGPVEAANEETDAVEALGVLLDNAAFAPSEVARPAGATVSCSSVAGAFTSTTDDKSTLEILPLAVGETICGDVVVWGHRTGGVASGSVGDSFCYRRSFCAKRASGNVLEVLFEAQGTDTAEVATWASPADNTLIAYPTATVYELAFIGTHDVTVDVGYTVVVRRIST